MRAWRLLLAVVMGASALVARAEPASLLEQAWLRLQQRDYAGVQALLPTLKAEQAAQAELLALSASFRSNGQLDEAGLSALQARYPDDAWLQFRAGQLWARRAREANLFTMRGYAKRYTAATRRAAELAATEPRLLLEAAIAAGQPAMFGGEPERQAEYVAKLAALDPHYHLIAQMDLVQNARDEQAGRKLIQIAGEHYAEQLLVLTRAAHLAWTYEDEPLAQRLFLQACELTVNTQREELWARWADACSNAGALAANGHGDRQRSANALKRHVATQRVSDDEQAELHQLLSQLRQ